MAKTADTFFSCRETPVYFPSGLLVTDISGSPTTKVRLNSPSPGVGNLRGPIDGFYYDINESTQACIYYNGVMYNLRDSIMSFPGVHTIAGFSKPCDAEMILTFQPSQTNVLGLPKIILCVAVQSGVRMTPASKKYFSTLIAGSTSGGRPTLAAILPKNVSYLEYQGFDVSLLYGGAKCSAIKAARTNIAQYLVCQWPIGMTIADFQRFRSEIPMSEPVPGSGIAPKGSSTPAGISPVGDIPKQLKLPPTPTSDLTRARFLSQVTRLTNIVLESSDVVPPPAIKKGENGIPVPSMKCQSVKLNGAEGKLTMDLTGRHVTTLEKELQDEKKELEDGPGIEKCKNIGDVEWGLVTLLGVAIGVILCCLVTYFVMYWTFPNYGEVVAQAKSWIPSGPLAPLPLPSLPQLPTICKD